MAKPTIKNAAKTGLKKNQFDDALVHRLSKLLTETGLTEIQKLARRGNKTMARTIRKVGASMLSARWASRRASGPSLAFFLGVVILLPKDAAPESAF